VVTNHTEIAESDGARDRLAEQWLTITANHESTGVLVTG
jgi:hypothetical protein